MMWQDQDTLAMAERKEHLSWGTGAEVECKGQGVHILLVTMGLLSPVSKAHVHIFYTIWLETGDAVTLLSHG